MNESNLNKHNRVMSLTQYTVINVIKVNRKGDWLTYCLIITIILALSEWAQNISLYK